MKKTLLCLMIGTGVLLADFSRDDVNGIVTDNSTGLLWQDDVNITATWQGALDYCEALELGGHTDWRLSNQNELHSIADYSRTDPAIDPVFQNVVSSDYWSSTSIPGYASYARDLRFENGRDNAYGKGNSLYVRCVRGGE